MSTNVSPRAIRTAVLGIGMSARVFHIPFILSLPSLFTLHAVWERSATTEHSVARDLYGATGVKVVTTLEDILADPDVDLVVVSTPNSTHYPYAKAILSRGKHVVVEKPLVTSSKQATDLIKLANSQSLVLATYQNRRWDSDFLTLRRLLEVEHVFGDIAEFESRYDRWRPSLKGGGTWKEEAEWGHGVVFDLGSHLIDQVLTLFGKPKSISAHIWNSRAQGPEKFDDAFIAHFTYPPGSFQRENSAIPLMVTVRSASLSLSEPQLRFTIKGTKATWVKFGVDAQEDQLKLHPPMSITHADFGVEPKENEGLLTTEQGGLINTRTVPTAKGDYLHWYRNVGQAIQEKDPNKLILKPQQAKEVIMMIELIYRSHQERTVVDVV